MKNFKKILGVFGVLMFVAAAAPAQALACQPQNQQDDSVPASRTGEAPQAPRPQTPAAPAAE